MLEQDALKGVIKSSIQFLRIGHDLAAAADIHDGAQIFGVAAKTGIAPLDRARSTDITFLDNPKYLDGLATTRADVCVTAPRFTAQAPDKLAVLVAQSPTAPS